jgi:SAM-dependent methyltransferase
MIDFWEEFGLSYMAFSQHCDFFDWRNIIDTITNEIDRLKQKRPILDIVDIGCGFGKNIMEIEETLYTKHKIFDNIDIFEPSEKAYNILKLSMLQDSYGGYINNIYNSFDSFSQKKYDAIIFMHSAYYIKDFNRYLENVYSNNLKKDGIILILALPSSSAFFLGQPSLVLPYTADEIIEHLSKSSLTYSTVDLDSHFYFDEKRLKFLYKFMTREKISLEQYSNLMNTLYLNKKVNFSDKLIKIS